MFSQMFLSFACILSHNVSNNKAVISSIIDTSLSIWKNDSRNKLWHKFWLWKNKKSSFYILSLKLALSSLLTLKKTFLINVAVNRAINCKQEQQQLFLLGGYKLKHCNLSSSTNSKIIRSIIAGLNVLLTEKYLDKGIYLNPLNASVVLI